MKTLQHMLVVQYESGDDGNLLSALGLTEERVKYLLSIMDMDIKAQAIEVKEKGGDVVAFNSLQGLVKHIESGDFTDADLMFLLHVAYTERRNNKRQHDEAFKRGIEVGYQASENGIPQEVAVMIGEMVAGQSAAMKIGGGFSVADLKDLPGGLGGLFRTRGKDPEGERG